MSPTLRRAALVATALFTGGCGDAPPPTDATLRKMEVAGIVRGLNPAETSVIEGLAVGDAIRFELIVTPDDSWIENVRPVASSGVNLPPKPAATPATSTTDRLQEGDPLPEFELVDQENRAIAPETFAGKTLLLTFIFTRCPVPNYCPLMSAQFADLAAEIATDPALSDHTRLLSISFDPEFDTPEVLTECARRFTDDGESWRFATGDPSGIEKLTRAFSVYLEGEGGSISPGLCTALVDPDGTIREIWRVNGWKPAEVMAALRSSPTPGENNAASLDLRQGAPTADTRASTQPTNHPIL